MREQTRPVVGFLGPSGTYTHQAAYECFQNDAVYREQATISDVLESLGSFDFGVVPRENSIFGSVIETFDGLRTLDAVIRAEIVLKIQHCLIVRKGTKLSDIECVMSHEQALGQCRGFVSKHLPSATSIKTTSTAAAAEAVSQSKTSNIAAICSSICITMFDDLEILHKGIQDEDLNCTRFFVLTRDTLLRPPNYPIHPNRALIRFNVKPPLDSETTPNLTKILKAIALCVTRIDRRPAPQDGLFCDTYFLEVNSPATTLPTWLEEVGRAISRLQAEGISANIMGLW